MVVERSARLEKQSGQGCGVTGRSLCQQGIVIDLGFVNSVLNRLQINVNLFLVYCQSAKSTPITNKIKVTRVFEMYLQ